MAALVPAGPRDRRHASGRVWTWRRRVVRSSPAIDICRIRRRFFRWMPTVATCHRTGTCDCRRGLGCRQDEACRQATALRRTRELMARRRHSNTRSIRLQIGMAALLAAGQCLGRAQAQSSQESHETIIAIRHRELQHGGLGQLSCKGLNRALALPRLFASRYPASSSTLTAGVRLGAHQKDTARTCDRVSRAEHRPCQRRENSL